MNPEKLIEEIKNILGKKYIKKSEVLFIETAYENIKYALTKEEKLVFDQLINIINKNKICVSEQKSLLKINQIVIKIINKYAEEFNDMPNEDKIDPNKTIDQIKKELNDKVPQYKYSENNPMLGITFDNKKNLWRFQRGKFDIKNIDLTKLITIAKEILVPNFSGNSGEDTVERFFSHKNYYFLTYMDNDDCYFDIRHIIAVFNLKKTSSNDKYNEFASKIVKYKWEKNEFGGYILHELINEETMYELILSSNSVFSQTFKTSIAKILVQLRKDEALEITNDEFKLKPQSKKYVNEDTELGLLMNTQKEYQPLSCKNPSHMEYVMKLILNGRSISKSAYHKIHILYCFIMPLRSDENIFIIKFGYTEDINERISTLSNSYKCSAHLIGLKVITGKNDEQEFHKILKKNYKNLIHFYKKNNKKKVELYKFHPQLLIEFDNYLSKSKNLNEDINLQKHQSFDFIDFLNHPNFKYYLQTTTNFSNINEYFPIIQDQQNTYHVPSLPVITPPLPVITPQIEINKIDEPNCNCHDKINNSDKTKYEYDSDTDEEIQYIPKLKHKKKKYIYPRKKRYNKNDIVTL